MDYIDFTIHCRICLVKKEQMISIYNKSEQKISDNQQIIKISYKDMLEECASIHISTESGLPKHICFNCSKLLQQFYKLRIQCVISDRILKKCLSKLNDNSSIMVENDSTDCFDYQLGGIKSVSSNSDSEEIMIEEHLDMSGEQNITKTKMSSDIDQTELNQIKMSSDIDSPDISKMSIDSNQTDVHQTKMSFDVNRTKMASILNETKMSSDVNRTKMASNLNETKMSFDVNRTKMASNLNETKILNKELKCSLCEIIIDKEEEFIKHTNEIHLKELHKCNLCNKYYINLSALQLHLYNHENRCKYCMKTFENNTELNDHIQMDHEQKSEYPCSICGILCKTKTILKSHKRKHAQPEEYLCPYCGKVLKDAAFMKEHLGLHTGEKRFNCKYCDLKFVFRTALYSHMVTHTKISKYKCKICLKSFCRAQILRRHLLTHATEKKYACKICGWRFRDPSDMRRHTQIHSGLKAHTCEFCKRSFIRKYQLTVHLRTHMGIKPFACTECDKKFSQKHVLISHMNRHHDKT